uniref:Hypothetical chloroplast RF21 n=1 Tax=Campanula americana TaxID=239430 RepID=A0A088PYE2_9ASTR|nr:hypothetical chloroplast RF21 [Campanula americana]
MNKQFKLFLSELKGVLKEKYNSPSNPFTSVRYLIRIFLDPRRLIKLFDPLVWRIVLSYTFNPPGLTVPMKILRFFNLTIKSGIFFVVAVLIYRSNNHINYRNLVIRKRFLREFFPLQVNSSELQNDPLEESIGPSPADRLLILLLSPPTGTKISGRRTQREIEQLIEQLIKERSSLSDASILETEQAETEQAETEQAETEQAETEQAETEQAETEQAETEQAETEQAETEQSETEQAETEQAEPEQAETEQAEPKQAERAEVERQRIEMEQEEDSIMSRLWERIEQFTRNRTRSVSFLLGEFMLRQRVNTDQKFLRKEHDFSVFRRAENAEIVKLFKIIPYLYNTVSIRPIPSDPIVPLPSGFRKFRNLQESYDKMTEFEQRFVLMLLFLSETITNPIDWQYKIVVFANNKIMEAVNQYRLIGNLIQFQSSIYRSIRNVLTRFFHNFDCIISKFIKTYKNPYILQLPIVISFQGQRQYLKTTLKAAKAVFPDYKSMVYSGEELPALYAVFPDYKSMVYSGEELSALYEDWADYIYSAYRHRGAFWLIDWLIDWLTDCDQNRLKFSLKKWKSLVDDHEPCQKISKSMLYSFYEDLKKKPETNETKRASLKSFRASLPKTYSDLSMVFDGPNWMNPVKPFRRSSLISAFYKANRLQSVTKPDYFSFYCNKRFPFYVETAPINYYHFIYRQFLNTLFIRNKKFSLGDGQKTHAFSEREILSAIQSEVSKILKSLDFPRGSDPFIRRASYSILDNRLRHRASQAIVDISGTPSLTEEEIFDLEKFVYSSSPNDPLNDPFSGIVSDEDSYEKSVTEKQIQSLEETYCQSSNINLPTLDSEVPNVDQSLSDININLDINLADLEGTNFDQSFSDININRDKNIDHLEGTNFDQSFSDININRDKNIDHLLKDLKGINHDLEEINESLSNININLDINLDDSEGTNFDESLSDINLDDLVEGINFDESLSDINLDDLVEGINFDESLSDINLDDSEGMNFPESLSAFCAKLQKILMSPSSLFDNFSALALELEKMSRKADHRRRQRDFLIKQNKLRHLYLNYLRIAARKRRMDKKKSAVSTRRSKGNLFKKYVSQTKWKLFKKYLPWVLTLSGLRYETSLFLEIVSDLWHKIWDRERRRLRVSEITVPIRICRKNWRRKWRRRRNWPTQWAREWTKLKEKWKTKFQIGPMQWSIHWTRDWMKLKEKLRLHWKKSKLHWKRDWTKSRRHWKREWTKSRIHWKREWTKSKEKLKPKLQNWAMHWMKSKEKWNKKLQKWATKFQKWDSKVFNLTPTFILIMTACKACKEGFPKLCIYLKSVWLESQLVTSDRALVILKILFALVLISFGCISLLQLLLDFLKVLITFKKVKSLIMDDLMIEIELEELLDEYPPSEWPTLELRFQNFCVGLLENMLFPSPSGLRIKTKSKFFNINLSPIFNFIKILNNELINLIKIIIKELTFVIKTRSISRTTKEIFSLLRQRKKVDAYWNQVPDWVLTNEWVEDEEREVLMQFVTLRRTRSISEILWSLTSSDGCLGKNDLLPEMIDQPGEVYLRKVIDFHKKDILNYEFDTSFLPEKRIFLALYHTMNYPQTSSDPVLSRKKPFSLRLSLAPSKSILVIGSRGIGRSYLVNYLGKNSYLPFITIFLDKFRGTVYRWDEEFEEEEEDREAAQIELPFSWLDDIDTKDEIEHLSDDIQSIHQTDWSFPNPLLGFLDLVRYKGRGKGPLAVLEDVSMDMDYETEPMDTVVYVATVYSSLQIELAKAMSPCLIWIPNIHEIYFGNSTFFTLGLLGHLLSWDCERSSSSNNLVIASTHMPQYMEPSLIDPRRFTMCIKVRKPSISQQRKHFSILSDTSGFRLEREILNIPHGFESLTLGSTAEDLAALTNEALLISLSQGKSIIDSNTMRHALHRQTWDLRAELKPINNSRILFYQIGRVVVHYKLQNHLNECPIDPISIYMNQRFCQEREPYLYRWYYQLGMNMKKLTILIYVLTCSSGLVAQELWSPSELNANNAIASGSLVDSNSDLVHGLLEIEGVLEGFLPIEKDCSQFDNRVPGLRRPEPRNPSDIVHTGFWSIIDEKQIYQKDPLAPPIVIGGIEMDLPKMFDNFIVRAPRIWSPWGFLLDWLEKKNANEVGFPSWTRALFANQIDSFIFGYDETDLEENDSQSDEIEEEEKPSPLEHKARQKRSPFYDIRDNLFADDEGHFNPYGHYNDEQNNYISEAFLQSVYATRARIRACNEQIFFGITQFIWNPGNPFLLLSEDPYLVPVLFSDPELFPDQDPESWFFTGDIKNLKKSWFIGETQAKHCDWLIQRQKFLRRQKNSLSKGSLRSTALSESYQYLSNFLVSNKTLVNQMQKLLVRKRWLFPDDVQKFFNAQYHYDPAETRKN